MEKASRLKVDIVKHDYRGFVFVVHEEHGLMLLRCTRKKKKPPHWQLPGGHVDVDEFLAAGRSIAYYQCLDCYVLLTHLACHGPKRRRLAMPTSSFKWQPELGLLENSTKRLVWIS